MHILIGNHDVYRNDRYIIFLLNAGMRSTGHREYIIYKSGSLLHMRSLSKDSRVYCPCFKINKLRFLTSRLISTKNAIVITGIDVFVAQVVIIRRLKCP